jgi:hypothetical protein
VGSYVKQLLELLQNFQIFHCAAVDGKAHLPIVHLRIKNYVDANRLADLPSRR